MSAESSVVHVVLKPTGHPPMEFDGVLIARSSHLSGKRTIEVALYRLHPGPGLCFVVNYHTEWEREIPWCWVFRSEDYDGLASQVRKHAASEGFLPPGAGFPATEAYSGRQQRLRDELNGAVMHLMTWCMA